MSTVDVGFAPYDMTAHLTRRDADFVATIRTSDASDFPAGAQITMCLDTVPETLWPATVTGPAAAWNVDKTAVATLLADTTGGRHVRIRYSDDSGADLVWFAGRVVWHA